MKKFNESSNLRELIDTARQLGIYPFGRSKALLAQEVNAEIESRMVAAEDASTITIDLDTAMEALTEAEFSILNTLVNKVEAHQAENECSCGGVLCGQGGLLDMIENILPTKMSGPAGIGKSDVVRKKLEELGFKMVYLTDGE